LITRRAQEDDELFVTECHRLPLSATCHAWQEEDDDDELISPKLAPLDLEEIEKIFGLPQARNHDLINIDDSHS